MFKAAGFDRIEAAKDHRLDRLVAGEGGFRRIFGIGYGISDPAFPHVLYSRNQIADFANPKLFFFLEPQLQSPDFQRFIFASGPHHFYFAARFKRPVHDPDIGDHSAVAVVVGIKDQSLERLFWGSPGRRGFFYDRFNNLNHPFSFFGAGQDHFFFFDDKSVFELYQGFLNFGVGKIDLVDHRNDDQVIIDREIRVG